MYIIVTLSRNTQYFDQESIRISLVTLIIYGIGSHDERFGHIGVLCPCKENIHGSRTKQLFRDNGC